MSTESLNRQKVNEDRLRKYLAASEKLTSILNYHKRLLETYLHAKNLGLVQEGLFCGFCYPISLLEVLDGNVRETLRGYKNAWEELFLENRDGDLVEQDARKLRKTKRQQT